MRTKRFTVRVLDRYKREGRGTGTFGSYLPWHQIGRGDPASRGRSHLVQWQGRQHHLLSDLEWVIFQFVTRLPNVIDIREQFPLTVNSRLFELSDYDFRLNRSEKVQGSLPLSRALKIKHPRVRGDGGIGFWIMSTDLLVALRAKNGHPYLLAISCKYEDDLESVRTSELLRLEREYWRVRGVDWLLITPALFEKPVALAMRCALPWAFGTQVPKPLIEIVVRTATEAGGYSRATLLKVLAARFGDMDTAQRAFWQSVWSGALPIELGCTWRPHVPLRIISNEAVVASNPVASRRSSWN